MSDAGCATMSGYDGEATQGMTMTLSTRVFGEGGKQMSDSGNKQKWKGEVEEWWQKAMIESLWYRVKEGIRKL